MLLNTTLMGEGPPICLLHGLYGRHQNLLSLARHLATNWRVILLDLRNHGASPHAPGMDYATMAADVRETLDSVDATQTALLGHSMGGKVAMHLALETPQNVSRLIVADIAPVAYAHHNASIAAALAALKLTPSLTRQAASAALAPSVSDEAVRAFLLQNLEFTNPPLWKIGLANIAGGIQDIEGFPDLPAQLRYDGPTLFLAGGRSDYITEARHAIIRARFPAAQIITLPEAGHWLHADQPAAFAAELDNFLQSSRPI